MADKIANPLVIMDSRKRLDLTEWVIHFVHERKPENDPTCFMSDLAEEEYWCEYEKFAKRICEDRKQNGLPSVDDDTLYQMFCDSDKKVPNLQEIEHMDMRLPDYYDKKGEGKNILSPYEENEYEIDEDASAFSVLKKILHDGYIHSGWAVRNYSPSIYGPKTAVCFTEMPLYALIDYAKLRAEKEGMVSGYGLAFRRRELFSAGGRPVIYGLSGDYKETDKDENGVYQGRLLAAECGIGVNEQYRYVSTKMHRKYATSIDWTHEREWRWALPYDETGVPGIPFFLSPQYANYFSEIIVIVNTNEESDEIVEYLKALYDAGTTNVGFEYNTDLIASTKVISFESISQLEEVDMRTMKIENLPSSQMSVMPTYEVDEATLDKVKTCIKKAGEVSVEATKQFLDANPDFDSQKGYWGWAHICTCKIGKVTEALKILNYAKTFSDGVYYVHVDEYCTSNLALLEIGAKAAAKFLTDELGQYFFVKTKID